MNFLKKSILPFVVFLTGAAVLIIEVTAIRVLSPYFGNTIFTVSSVLGIILAALSFGYYLGGKLADLRPSRAWFFGIIFISGISVFILVILSQFYLPQAGYRFSITTGPLVMSLLLFFVPSFLLGTLSPFAIKLQHLFYPEAGIGAVSGTIFFWSTLGSIIGSLATGFYFIPNFGIREILLFAGFFLFLLGFLGLYFSPLSRRSLIIYLVITVIIAALFLFLFFVRQPVNALYLADGVYERLSIFQGEYQEHPTLFFLQDRSISGAAFLDSDDLVFDYTKYYRLYKIFNPEIKQALVIGGGAYSSPRGLLKDLPEVKVDVAEIEPSLFELAKKYFRVPKGDSRLQNYVADGRRFLHDSPKTYDLIFSDVYYSLYSIPAHFTTKEFFELVRSKLNPDGIFLANIIGMFSRQTPSFTFSEMRTWLEVFPNSYFFAVDSLASSIEAQNLILVGYNSDKKLDFASGRFDEHPDPIIAGLPERLIDLSRFELSRYPKLFDNYSPVEVLISPTLKQALLLPAKQNFEGKEALAILAQQLRYGSRYLGSPGNQKTQDFIAAELEALGAKVIRQKFKEGVNLIGRFLPESENRIILGTHYDTKRFAVLDTKKPNDPVLGANDGASGVAVLLEVARVLASSPEFLNFGIDFVFFDGEEGEPDSDKTNWQPLGSAYFAQNLASLYPGQKPKLAIIIDMVCDKDLEIFKDQNSKDSAFQKVEEFWQIGQNLWPEIFQQETKIGPNDDHTPLITAGIPSILVIDFDYPQFHTAEDTLKQCSAQSLEAVGTTILEYLREKGSRI